jgi:putative ABC transport system permease protein
MPGVRRDDTGQPVVQPQASVLIEAFAKADGSAANIILSGTGAQGWRMSPALHLVAGRMYRPAVHELIVGVRARDLYRDFEIGRIIHLRGSDWRVVGVFEMGGAVLESGAIADAETVLAAFERGGFQSVKVGLTSPGAFKVFQSTLADHPELALRTLTEKAFAQNQVGRLTGVLNFVAYFVGGVMAIGVIFGSVTTLFSSVDARAREIATLRAVGFGAVPIMTSVMVEGLVLSMPGALIGAAAAWLLFDGRVTTAIGQTFSLAVTPGIMVAGVVIALIIGLVGAYVPALRAVKIPVSNALRAF